MKKLSLNIEPHKLNYISKKGLIEFIEFDDLNVLLGDQFLLEEKIQSLLDNEQKDYLKLHIYNSNNFSLDEQKYNQIFNEIKAHPNFEDEMKQFYKNQSYKTEAERVLFQKIKGIYIYKGNLDLQPIGIKFIYFDLIQKKLGLHYDMQINLKNPKLLNESFSKFILEHEKIQQLKEDLSHIKDDFKKIIKQEFYHQSFKTKDMINLLKFHFYPNKIEFIEKSEDKSIYINHLFFNIDRYSPIDYCDIYKKYYKSFLNGDTLEWSVNKIDYIQKKGLGFFLGLDHNKYKNPFILKNEDGSFNFSMFEKTHELWNLYELEKDILIKNNKHIDLLIHAKRFKELIFSHIDKISSCASIKFEEKKCIDIDIPLPVFKSAPMNHLFYQVEYLINKSQEKLNLNFEQKEKIQSFFKNLFQQYVDLEKNFYAISIIEHQFKDYVQQSSILNLLPFDHPDKKYLDDSRLFFDDHMNVFHQKTDSFQYLIEHWKKQDKKTYVLKNLVDDKILNLLNSFLNVEFDIKSINFNTIHENKHLVQFNCFEKVLQLYSSSNKEIFNLLFQAITPEDINQVSSKVKIDCLSLLRNDSKGEKLSKVLYKIKDNTDLNEVFIFDNPKDGRNGKNIIEVLEMLKDRFHKDNIHMIENILIYWNFLKNNEIDKLRKKGMKL